MNIKELSTKGFISNFMLLYLISVISLVGIVCDKIIKTDKILINLNEFKDSFRIEREAVLRLKQYLNELKRYDEELERYQEYLYLLENSLEVPEYSVEEPEILDSLEYLYVDDELVVYNFTGNYVDIYFRDVILTVIFDDYRIISYSFS